MFKDKTIVYTSGTFDMFHYNHLRMINYARSLADILIVGVSTDELVSSYKAKPIIPFHERLQIIEALKTPDIVIPQHSLDHTEIVKKLKGKLPLNRSNRMFTIITSSIQNTGRNSLLLVSFLILLI